MRRLWQPSGNVGARLFDREARGEAEPTGAKRVRPGDVARLSSVGLSARATGPGERACAKLGEARAVARPSALQHAAFRGLSSRAIVVPRGSAWVLDEVNNDMAYKGWAS